MQINELQREHKTLRLDHEDISTQLARIKTLQKGKGPLHV